MEFLKNVKKDLSDIVDIEAGFEPPRYWFGIGNYVLNYIMSGNFTQFIPQGRLAALAGSAGSGKSFLACNAMREAQQDGAFIVVLDSENALDPDFVSKLGVDVSPEKFMYVPVDTIPQVQTVVSRFITGYKKEFSDIKNAPKILFIIDSLDMLVTETESDNFDKGVLKGDQGQRSKQLKSVLRQFVQAIKGYNISMVVTCQVYKNQDVTNGEGVWIISDAVKYSLSQIGLLTKLKLKDDKDTKAGVIGIRMMCEGYKTRFTRPYQKVTIEVPYETGMDKYSGLLETCVALGIVEKAGSRYRIKGDENTWYSKDIATVSDRLLEIADKKSDLYLIVDESEIDVAAVDNSTRKSRIAEKLANS